MEKVDKGIVSKGKNRGWSNSIGISSMIQGK